MTLPPDRRFTLLHDGQLLVAETRRVGVEIDVRLSIGGKEVAAGRNWLEPVRLAHHDFIVEVRFTWLGQVTGVALVLHDESEIPFTPPPGSFAARLQALAVDYPALYASRRIVVALALLGGGLFGIWAILWAFLSTLGLPGPGIPWVDPGMPGWLRSILGIPGRPADVPFGWIQSGYAELSARLGLAKRSTLPASLWSWLPNATIWIPLVLAVFLAIGAVWLRRGQGVRRDPSTSQTTAARDAGAAASPLSAMEASVDDILPITGPAAMPAAADGATGTLDSKESGGP